MPESSQPELVPEADPWRAVPPSDSFPVASGWSIDPWQWIWAGILGLVFPVPVLAAIWISTVQDAREAHDLLQNGRRQPVRIVAAGPVKSDHGCFQEVRVTSPATGQQTMAASTDCDAPRTTGDTLIAYYDPENLGRIRTESSTRTVAAQTGTDSLAMAVVAGLASLAALGIGTWSRRSRIHAAARSTVRRPAPPA